MIEFINLLQGCMSVHEYSFKFTKLSKYALSLVSDPRDKISHFVLGVSDDLQDQCHSSMMHDNLNISFLMVHAKMLKRQGL